MKLKISLVLLLALVSSYATASLVATLYHEGDVKMFYSNTAFKEAVDAADHGDLICLSAGTFVSNFTINKAVTIRGTGSTGKWTVFDIATVTIPDSVEASFVLEGVQLSYLHLSGNMENVVLNKDVIFNLYLKNCTKSSVLVRNCQINRLDKYQGVNASFVNCFICTSTTNRFSCSTPQAIFLNCLISVLNYTNGGSYSIENAVFYNCLLTGSTNFEATVDIHNCILFANYKNYGNMWDSYTITKSDFQTVSVGTGTYDTRLVKSPYYVLSDSIRTTMLGSDGTEIGLRGGEYPYTLKPSYPVITSMKVAGKVTVDEKLSVDINVQSQQ